MLRQLTWPRVFIHALVATLIAGWIGYTVALAHRVTSLKLALDEEVARAIEMDRKHELENTTEDNRLLVLESTVFGTTKPPEKVQGPPAWLLNSVKQNSDRINALERWRLKVDSEIK